MKFDLHDEKSAPQESQPMLEAVKKQFDFIPNVLAEMAESPAALKSYLDIHQNLEKSSLSAGEKEVLFLSVSKENSCGYCMAAHTGGAKQAKVPDHVIDSLRNKQAVDDPKLQALSNLATELVSSRGKPNDKVVQDFFDQGYTKANFLDVIAVISMKTLSNYLNHVAHTPIDEAFKSFE